MTDQQRLSLIDFDFLADLPCYLYRITMISVYARLQTHSNFDELHGLKDLFVFIPTTD